MLAYIAIQPFTFKSILLFIPVRFFLSLSIEKTFAVFKNHTILAQIFKALHAADKVGRESASPPHGKMCLCSYSLGLLHNFISEFALRNFGHFFNDVGKLFCVKLVRIN